MSNYKKLKISCLSRCSAQVSWVSALCSPNGKRYSSSIFPSVFITLSILCIPDTAYAYLDPGTGSMILQGLIAGLMGALFTIKIYWARIKNFFSSSTKGEEKELDIDEQ